MILLCFSVTMETQQFPINCSDTSGYRGDVPKDVSYQCKICAEQMWDQVQHRTKADVGPGLMWDQD